MRVIDYKDKLVVVTRNRKGGRPEGEIYKVDGEDVMITKSKTYRAIPNVAYMHHMEYRILEAVAITGGQTS